IMKNGGNEDGIILDGSRKMKPLKFLPDADLEEADRLLVDLLVGNMTCPQGDRFLILSWLSCFLLIDFAGTRPMTRFEGSAGSGKTTASKITSTLLYGEPQHKKATDAANYTDGSQNPLIVLDNIEVKQMTEDLTTFMLTSITGIAKEKRKSGTDSETITERTKCLLNTTGIEPLCGELSEILSRSFVINFDLANQASDCFLESEVISAIQQNRDLIISAIMKRTSHVLAMIRDGAQKQVMRLLHRTMPTHGKRRCNDYLSLMYLMMLAGSEEHEVTTGLEELSPLFIEQIHSINDTSQEMARESNPIATALASLFHAYRNAVELDEKARYGEDDRANHVVGFIERYQVRFENENTMEPVSAGRLLAALRRVGREFNLEFEYKKPAQLGRRISNDLDVIRDAGFDIDRQRNAHTKNFEYRIAKTANF
ncbi:MAG: DNA primase, partial [Proteobacteria bacterium]|nr:DNA primase [Pseudomonadota bacterium]